MGFLTVGRRFLLDQNEIIDDRIDVVCRGLLGLTVTCARCHDHKFDPIPTEDYYSLYGVFASSLEPAELPLLTSSRGGPAAANYEKKLAELKRARDDYLAARRGEIEADLAGRFSVYLRAAYDLGFDPRNRKLEERAGVDKLNSRRLRTVIGLWKQKLEAPAPASDPLLSVWRAFAVLPSAEYAAQRQGSASRPGQNRQSQGLRDSSAGGQGSPRRQCAWRARRNWLVAMSRFSARSNRGGRIASPIRTKLAEPEWESLRLCLHGPGGPLAISDEMRAGILDQTQRGRLDRLNGEIDKLNATHPAAPARAMVMNDTPQLYEPHVFLRGNPGRAGTSGSPSVSRGFSPATIASRFRRGAAGSSWPRPSPTRATR